MPLKDYGVLAAGAVARRREGAHDTPHYQIQLRDHSGTDFRAAVNVLSQQAPPDLLYLVDDNFRHPLTQQLPPAGSGWTGLSSEPGRAAMDFIRGNLFDPAAMRPIAPDLPGLDNDLADLLDHYVLRAVADPTIAVYIFGQRFGPEPGIPDKVFHFLPGNGVHDVHMNQGNRGRFVSDDGVWQDGGLLFHLPSESRWVAIFLAFQSQAWHTDDTTGHALAAVAPSTAGEGEGTMRIMAARVNPVGPAPKPGTITLLNASADAVDLTGWCLADGHKRRTALPAGQVDAGATVTIPVSDGFELGNHGGAITLLDAAGLKVHGVAYTGRQAAREGQTIAF
ncbi:DUF2278 family protein [Streptacidiphilus griseoplanus]|uniref:DUF2278 family protein n=1 Tax=Peterkaempfera griseoplana TaxID=66896 RepID=UPI0006E263BE|nr:DUF2278 family protein [Peterkaempfera griseoplana]